MNERIKQLMDEAVRFRLDPDSKQYEAQVSPEDLEVFALLIVMSVMDDLEKMREKYDNPGMYEPIEYYDRQAAKEVAMEDALDTIRYNFGIKS